MTTNSGKSNSGTSTRDTISRVEKPSRASKITNKSLPRCWHEKPIQRNRTTKTSKQFRFIHNNHKSNWIHDEKCREVNAPWSVIVIWSNENKVEIFATRNKLCSKCIGAKLLHDKTTHISHVDFYRRRQTHINWNDKKLVQSAHKYEVRTRSFEVMISWSGTKYCTNEISPL